MSAADSGNPRYWYFVPGRGMWLVPATAGSPHVYAKARGAAVLFYGTTKDRKPVARFPQEATR